MNQDNQDHEAYTSLADPALAAMITDLPQTMTTIQNYSARLKDLRTALLPTMNTISTNKLDQDIDPDSEFFVNNGISFLQLRTQILTQYNINLLQYMMLRADGRKIKDHPCIARMVHFRLLLERIKPITTQLQFQIDQTLQQAQQHQVQQQTQQTLSQSESGSTPHGKQLSQAEAFTAEIPMTKEQINAQKKAEYAERQAELKAQRAEQDAELSKLNRNLKFTDPKQRDQYSTANVGDDAASQWHAQERIITMEKERKEKIKDKALYSTLVRQLREELTDRPAEESASGLSRHQFRTREQLERVAFEEDNYSRLVDSKEDRKRQRRMERLQGMDDIEDVADYRALYQLDTRQKAEKEKEKALREFEAQEAKQHLMDTIEANVRKNSTKPGGSSGGVRRKRPDGGF